MRIICRRCTSGGSDTAKASLLRKAAGPTGAVSLVDVYGTLLASRLFVPSDLRAIDPRHVSLRSMRRSVDSGKVPLPIFTAIQYSTLWLCCACGNTISQVRMLVAPPNASAKLHTSKSRPPSLAADKAADTNEKLVHAIQESRCIWYEFTPYEVGSDELGGEHISSRHTTLAMGNC